MNWSKKKISSSSLLPFMDTHRSNFNRLFEICVNTSKTFLRFHEISAWKSKNSTKKGEIWSKIEDNETIDKRQSFRVVSNIILLDEMKRFSLLSPEFNVFRLGHDYWDKKITHITSILTKSLNTNWLNSFMVDSLLRKLYSQFAEF